MSDRLTDEEREAARDLCDLGTDQVCCTHCGELTPVEACTIYLPRALDTIDALESERDALRHDLARVQMMIDAGCTADQIGTMFDPDADPTDEAIFGAATDLSQGQIEVEHWTVRMLGYAFLETLERDGGENYVEFSVRGEGWDPEEHIAVTVRYHDGETPAQKAARLEDERDHWRDLATASLSEILERLTPADVVDYLEAAEAWECLGRVEGDTATVLQYSIERWTVDVPCPDRHPDEVVRGFLIEDIAESEARPAREVAIEMLEGDR